MSGDLLAAVAAAAQRSAEERARADKAGALERAAAARQPRGAVFARTLAAPGVRIIAECKRRSPSRGILRADYDPVAMARAYVDAGAAAISVLTEPTFFDGSLDHLRAVREAVKVTTTLLRKDFIVTDVQLVEARAAGADAVLLIVAALDDAALRRLMARAFELDLAALVEVHDGAELSRAVDAGATIVGVNSRNLRTLEVDASVFESLAGRLPSGGVAVAESGLGRGADLVRLRALGYHAFLIGERFVTAEDPGQALRDVLQEAEGATP